MIALLDIGGTQIKYGVFNEMTQKLTPLGKLDTGTSDEDFFLLNRIHQVINEIKKRESINGIAISTAGIIDPVAGKVLHANGNIPNFIGTPIKDELEKVYGVPCSVENDVNCALLGELHFGELNTINNALMLTIGTGVGGSVYINGQIFHGSSFSAGEVGYSYLGDDNIETVASARALVDKVKQRVNKEDIDGHWVFQEAQKGNQICIEEIDSFVQNIVKIIINNVSVLNPEVVILGGGIMEQKEYLSEKINERFKLYQNAYVRKRTQIHFASLGNQAGMLGAYIHFKNQLETVRS
ncbi:ROK family protein [Alkalibacterium iburiense]|uniref:ROK family protein n=1 Tax=Alkalibacterium iburiense TaxID=290589 RepID=A0ABP3HEM3_9LACT